MEETGGRQRWWGEGGWRENVRFLSRLMEVGDWGKMSSRCWGEG